MARYAPVLLLCCIPLITAPGCGGDAPRTAGEAATVDRAPLAADVPAGGAKPAAADAAEISRKIIYNATLEVIVDDLDATTRKVEAIVAEADGYVAKSDVVGNTGTRRTATWVLKIPSAKFRETLAALAALGTPVRNASESEDVTEEFYDLQARVKTLKAEEESLNAMLGKETEKQAILTLRREITELRVKIESAEGRLRYLSARTALSTITLSVSEDAEYVPPTAPEPPGFRSRVADTFANSFGLLRRFGEQIGLILVALAPWSPLILVGVLLLRWLVRAERRARLGRQSTPSRERRSRQTLAANAPPPVAVPVPDPDPTTADDTRPEGRSDQSGGRRPPGEDRRSEPFDQ